MWEIQVQSLGQEDPLEKEMVTHSSILAWKIPWREEPGRLHSMGLQRVRHDWETSLSLFHNHSSMIILQDTVRKNLHHLHKFWTFFFLSLDHRKSKKFQKNIYFCFIDYAKAFVCVDHNKLCKTLKKWEYQTTWPASWKICMQAKKQQLEPDMEPQTGSKLGK